MNLSDKLVHLHDLKKEESGYAIKAGDIREFIKVLKDKINIKLGEDKNYSNYEETWGNSTDDFFNLIDELAGEKLI